MEATYSGAYTYARFTAINARTGLEAWSAIGDKLFTRGDQGWVVAALAPNPFMPRMELINGRTNKVTRWDIDLVRRAKCVVGQPIGANRPIGLAADYLWLEVEDGCGHFLQRTSLTEAERASEAPFASEAGDTFVPTNSQSHVLLERHVNRGTGTVGGEVMLLDLASLTMMPLPSDVHHADQGWLLGELLVVRDADTLTVVSLPDATLRLRKRLFTSDWDVICSTRTALVVHVGDEVVALRVPGRVP